MENQKEQKMTEVETVVKYGKYANLAKALEILKDSDYDGVPLWDAHFDEKMEHFKTFFEEINCLRFDGTTVRIPCYSASDNTVTTAFIDIEYKKVLFDGCQNAWIYLNSNADFLLARDFYFEMIDIFGNLSEIGCPKCQIDECLNRLEKSA